MHELMLMKSFGNKVLILGGKLQYERTPSSLEVVTDSLLLPITHLYQGGIKILNQDKQQKDFISEIYSSFLNPLNTNWYIKYELGFDNKSSKLNSNIDNGGHFQSDTLANNLSIDIRRFYNNIELVKNRGVVQFKLALISNLYNQSVNRQIAIENSTFYRFSPRLNIIFKIGSKSKLDLSFSSDYRDNPVSNFNNNIIVDSYKSYKRGSRATTLFNHKYTVRGLFSYFDHFNGLSVSLR